MNPGYINKEKVETKWIEDSGIALNELEEEVKKLETKYSMRTKAIIKAKAFELILSKGQIAIDSDTVFQNKLNGKGILASQRSRWAGDVYTKYLAEDMRTKHRQAAAMTGTYLSTADTGHTTPNTKELLELGFNGLLERIKRERGKKTQLTIEQADFYESCEIMLGAMSNFTKRLAEAVKPYSYENYVCLLNIADGRPQNIYEAMQLLIVYFNLHEFIAGARVRTLGRLDKMLYPFYVNDIKNGTYTKDEIEDLVRDFLKKFWDAKVPYDLPFMLGGIDENDEEITNDLSYLIVNVYNDLNIYSPKIHIRISDKTPELFVKLVLDCIRNGNSSFLLVNDAVAIRALERTGVTIEEAKDYILVGCYEPAVWGVELPCTGGASVNLVKAVELAITGGRDFASGEMIGIETEIPTTYEEFIFAVKAQLKYICECAMDYAAEEEKYYMEMYPDPIISSMIPQCAENGKDAYAGGAKYNNSSLNLTSIASLVNSVMAVKKIVFEDKVVSFEEMTEILKNNWSGNEDLRLRALSLKEKYGNNHKETDEVMTEFCQYAAELINGRPNARGGIFKAGLFSIDLCFSYGAKTMATPDGRKAGESLSKNLCAVSATDRGGITALINSVTKIDLSDFPNGSVLDVVLHPSAVQGEDGLSAVYGIVKTYFAKGGFAVHGNVFDASELRNAQEDPEKYATLQVRVCGWNAYFVNLSKAEQEEFIKQAEQTS